MSDVKYDPQIIQKFVNSIYKKANSLIRVWTLIGVVVGIPVGSIIGDFIALKYRVSDTAGLAGGIVFCAAVGFVVGSSKAFSLKFNAQMLMCLKQIEENTKA